MNGFIQLFLALLWASVVATGLAGVLWLFERLAVRLVRAAWLHALWCMVALTLVLPLLSLLPWQAVGSHLIPAASGSSRPVFAAPGSPSLLAAPLAGTATMPGGGMAMPLPTGQGWRMDDLLGGAAAVWLAAFSLGGLILAGWYLLASLRLRSGAQAPTPGQAQCFTALKARHRACRQARLMVSRHIGTPAVFGWSRPLVCLPAGMAGQLADKELHHVLDHELCHIRHRDHRLVPILQLVRLLHWFNPLVWLLCRHIDRLRELACDETLVQGMSREERRSYGSTLLIFASQARFAWRFPVPGMSRPVEDLKRRISLIGKPVQPQRTGLLLCLAIALFCGCGGIAGTSLALFRSADSSAVRAPSSSDALKLVGTWKVVDFVRTPQDFQPGKRWSKMDLPFQRLRVTRNGQVFIAWQNDNLRNSSMRLANGHLLDPIAEVDSAWQIAEKNGQEYLALAWMSGDVTIRHELPWYYIFEREDAKDQAGFKPRRLVPEDDLNPLFVDDPALIGNWRVMAVSSDSGDYFGDLGAVGAGALRGLSVRASGEATVQTYQSRSQIAAEYRSMEIAWTKGSLIFRQMQSRMPYVIETSGGREVLRLEWRDDNVIYGGEKAHYCVLARE